MKKFRRATVGVKNDKNAWGDNYAKWMTVHDIMVDGCRGHTTWVVFFSLIIHEKYLVHTVELYFHEIHFSVIIPRDPFLCKEQSVTDFCFGFFLWFCCLRTPGTRASPGSGGRQYHNGRRERGNAKRADQGPFFSCFHQKYSVML